VGKGVPVIVTLPWPDRRLSPNARIHWRAKAPVTAQARADAAKATMAAVNGGMREVRAALAGDSKIEMTVTFYPPDRRHRDDDGMISAFKAARDGIADALGVNDCRFRPHYVFAEPEKPGRIEVKLLGAKYYAPNLPLAANDPVDGLPPRNGEAA
jgi:crossover junction endodeoxyribonuclease RusA